MHDKSTTEPRVIGRTSGFRNLLGYRNTVWREGFAEIELLIDARHLNGLGIVHGGVSLTLLDAACGHAATWCPVPGNGRQCVTIALTTSFLVAGSPGLVRAIGHLLAAEYRVATCRAEVLDEAGRVLAAAQGSFRYMAGSERLEGVPRVPG